MRPFGIKLNFNFKNQTLDKLFQDANQKTVVAFDTVSKETNLNYQANAATKYDWKQTHEVETLDLSANVKGATETVKTSMNHNSNSNGQTAISPGEANTPFTNVDSRNQNSNIPSSYQANSSGETISSIEKGKTFESNSTPLKGEGQSRSAVGLGETSNSSSSSFSNSSHAMNPETQLNSATSIKMQNQTNQVNASISSSASPSSMSATPMSRAGNMESKNWSPMNPDSSFIGQSPSDLGDINQNFNENSTIVETEQTGNQAVHFTEMNFLAEREQLQNNGFIEADMDRLVNGKITLEQLIEEIQLDPNSLRRKKLMESSYLQAYGLNVNNMEDFKKNIEQINQQLKESIASNSQNTRHELDTIMNYILRLKMGESLENILKNDIVAWKYQDASGTVCYRYDNPYTTNDDGSREYQPLTFAQLYPNSQYLEELKSVLTVETVKPLWQTETVVHKWQDTEIQTSYFERFSKNYQTWISQEKEQEKQTKEQIEVLQQQKATYEFIYHSIEKELDYYFQKVDCYITKKDFDQFSSFSASCLDSLDSIRDKYASVQVNPYDMNIPVVYVNDRSTLIDVLACMLNGQGNVATGLLRVADNKTIQLASQDDLFAHTQTWLPFINESEKEIFNYIYRTQGKEGAYHYLQSISSELDSRWLANKTQEDQAYASAHPILASMASIAITPLEGISAACYSLHARVTDSKIMRTDVYSSGDVWRGQVSSDIVQNHGQGLAFVYNTGMSIADSVSLVGLSIATGGSATPVLSTTLMGSRAYVSTLNDALERGLSDGAAVSLAFSAATVESAMEAYSVGHLLNLETKLGEATTKMVSKVANTIQNDTLANLATKTTYIMAGAISQGIAEGEEEFATEILNFVFDDLISKELSNHTLALSHYMELGYSEKEARDLSNQDFIKELGQAFLGGFVSGICFGSFAGTKTTYQVSKEIAQDITDTYQGNKAQRFANRVEDSIIKAVDLGKTKTNMNSIDPDKTVTSFDLIDRTEDFELDEQEIQRKNKDLLTSIRKSQPVLNVRQLSDLEMYIKKNKLGRLVQDPRVKNYMEGAIVELDSELAQKVALAEKLSEEISMEVGSLTEEEARLLEEYKQNEINNLELKRKIISKIDNISDPFAKARALYIELCKSVNYDATYIKGGFNVKNAIIGQDISFENLSEERKVVCKGWAQLYRELLLDANFSPENVEVKGCGHFWVEIKYGNQIIVADATDAMDGRIDLASVKAGMDTKGFIILPEDYSGVRLNSMYKQGQLTDKVLQGYKDALLKVDKSIGYATKNGYLFEQLSKAKKLFGKTNGLSSKILGTSNTRSTIAQVFDSTIPENIDGYEIYSYYKNILKNLLGEKEFSKMTFKTLYKNVDVSNLAIVNENIDAIFEMAYTNDKGESIHYLYGKNIGKLIFTDEGEYNAFQIKEKIFR